MEEIEHKATDSATSGQDIGAHGESHSPQGHKNIGMAVVAYLIFFVPLLTDAKDDPFVKYHVKQGLALFVAWLGISVVSMVPPIFFVSWILHIGMFVFLVIGIVHALEGKEEPLPLIGSYGEKLSF